jgi:hypothetical protein
MAAFTAVTILAGCDTPDAPGDAAPSTQPEQTLAGLRLDAPGPYIAGDAGTFTLSAVDSNGDLELAYRGTVRITSSDPDAGLPVELAFEGGIATAGVTFLRAGTQHLDAVDVTDPVRHARAEVQIAAAAVASFEITGFPAQTTAGSPFVAVITARDRFGNVADTFHDDAEITTGSSLDLVGIDRTFAGGILRVALTPIAAGFEHRIRVTAAGITAVSSPYPVAHAAPSRFHRDADPLRRTRVGVPAELPVIVLDRFDNIATSHSGPVFLSTFPSTGRHQRTFTPEDAGVGSISVTFTAPGTYTWIAGDGRLNGTGQGSIVVEP